MMNRRDFGIAITAASINTLAVPMSARNFDKSGSKANALSTGVCWMEFDLNRIHKWDNSVGDTWDPFWADDDQLYSFNCDGAGFGESAQNLSFNRFDGGDLSALVGSRVNGMAEYGPSTQRGPDSATWKVAGQACIEGVFYAFVTRNIYGSESGDAQMRQTAFNSSLIKSTDRGLTWTRSAKDNYAMPMWAGPEFGAPMFVHYGQNGEAPNRDGARDYIYACSTNGFWNNGDTLVLGRVAREKISQLSAADWEYFAGTAEGGRPRWATSIQAGKPILSATGKLSQTPITFVPSINAYLLISWYNPQRLPSWYDPTEMQYDFYQATYPWGPWERIDSFSDHFLAFGKHMYGPAICQKFQVTENGTTKVIMFTSGCTFEGDPSGIYKCWTIPLLLHTSRFPKSSWLAASHSSVKATGKWQTSDSLRRSGAAGNKLEFHITGTGLDIQAEKSVDAGLLRVSIDGGKATEATLSLINFPSITGVVVYSNRSLLSGNHIIVVEHAGGGSIAVEGFRIFS